MTDAYNRTIDYLRVSITDRCNLRCVYCMPSHEIQWIPQTQILTFEEILRLCNIIAGLGIRNIKVTGGEPLVRKGSVNFIRRLKLIEGIEQVTMTSNGLLLEDYLDELVEIGLDALNISLDTLDEDVFYRITRGKGLDKILTAIDRATAYGLPVKINCVPIRELNIAELMGIASLARNKNVAVRFIELMPLGSGNQFETVQSEEIFAMLEQKFGALTLFSRKLGNGPAKYYSVKGFRGKIGFINAVSHEFCQNCNRLRLTSNGILLPCLVTDTGLDVRALMRGSSSDTEIEQAIADLVIQKPFNHNFAEMHGKIIHEGKKMFRIGG